MFIFVAESGLRECRWRRVFWEVLELTNALSRAFFHIWTQTPNAPRRARLVATQNWRDGTHDRGFFGAGAAVFCQFDMGSCSLDFREISIFLDMETAK